jgi:PKD repeat protein
MKTKYILIIISFFIFCNRSSAHVYTWTGAKDTVFAITTNWTSLTGTTYPAANDTAIIVSTTNRPVLASSYTVTRLVVTSGAFNLKGYTFTVTGSGGFIGGVLDNGTLDVRCKTAEFTGTTFNTRVEVLADNISLSGGIFNEVCIFTTTGQENSIGTGGCVFNDKVQFIHNGNAARAFAIAQSSGDVYNDEVTIINKSNGQIRIAESDSTFFNGNIEINSMNSGLIYFGMKDGYLELASGKTIGVGDSGFFAGDLYLKNFTQKGNTAQTLTLTDSSTLFIQKGCLFEGNVTVTAPDILCGNATFNGTTHFTKTKISGNYWSGNNIFNGPTTITYQGTGGQEGDELRLTDADKNSYFDNATFESGGNPLQVVIFNGSEFHKNVSVNNAAVFMRKGLATFMGANAQQLNGTVPIDFEELLIDKSAGHLTLHTPVNIYGSVSFKNGKIISDSTNLLIFQPYSEAIGACNGSFVSGPVMKIGDTEFEFPVGKGNYYSPLEISAPVNSADAFIAEFIDSKQPFGTIRDTTLSLINQCTYWNLNRSNGSSDIKVKLFWTNNSCNISYPSSMRVANWDGAKWIDLERDTFGGNSLDGYIIGLNNPTLYSAFCLSNTIVPYTQNLIGSTILKDFCILAGDSISIDTELLVYGKVGSVTSINTNLIATDSIISYNGGSVPLALSNLSNSIAYCRGLSKDTISSNLTGQILNEGIYYLDGSGYLSGTLTLNGNDSSIFIIYTQGSLIIDDSSIVNLENVNLKNVYWVTEDEIFIGQFTVFKGIILTNGNVILEGSAWNQTEILSQRNIVVSISENGNSINCFMSANYLNQPPIMTNSVPQVCNLICNGNLEQGIAPFMEAGIADNKVICWNENLINIDGFCSVSGNGGNNTPDIMDVNTTNPVVQATRCQSSCFTSPISSYPGVPQNFATCNTNVRVIGTTRYGAFFPGESASAELASQLEQKIYFLEFYIRAGDCLGSFLNVSNLCFGFYQSTNTSNFISLPLVDPSIYAGANALTDWIPVYACVDLTNQNISNLALLDRFYISITHVGASHPRIFFDDFHLSDFGNAGPDVETTCEPCVFIGSTCSPINDNSSTVTINYLWNTSEVTAQIEVCESGIYSLTTTITYYDPFMDETHQCVSYDEVTVIINPGLSLSISSTPSTLGNNGTATVVVNNGIPNFDYLWSNSAASNNDPSSTNSINSLSPGVYTVTVSDGDGCTESISILVNGPCDAAFDNSPSCINSPVDFTITTSQLNNNYNWSFGDGNNSNLQNPSHSYSQPGYYEVVLVVSNTSCNDCFRKVIYVSPSCCAIDPIVVVYDGPSVVPDRISTNTTWTSNPPLSTLYYINRTIFVEEDVTLTIDDQTVIEFGPEGRIVLERRDPGNPTGTGARMIMGNNSLLTSVSYTQNTCPVMWRGVEVWGHSTINHNSNANRNAHARLTMGWEAKIANAHNGVILGRTANPFGDYCNPPPNDDDFPPFNIDYGGGILIADENNCIFEKNGNGIRIFPYKFLNSSKINGCYFFGGVLLDDFYDSNNSTFFYSASNSPDRNPWYGEANSLARSSRGIWIWGNNKMWVFEDNELEDIDKGMETFDSNIKTIINRFTNHRFGIDVFNTFSFTMRSTQHDGNKFKQINLGLSGTDPCLFNGNNAGIRINAGWNDKVWDENEFGNMQDPYVAANDHDQPFDYNGVSVWGSDNTSIRDNKFGQASIGVLMVNTSATSGYIGYGSMGNTFHENKIGLGTSGANPTLRVRCNYWHTSDFICANPAQIPMCWMNGGNAALPPQQGQAGTNTRRPAGNEFNTNAPFGPDRRISSGFPYSYFHHNQTGSLSTIPLPTTTSISLYNNGIAKTSLSCPSFSMNVTELRTSMDSLEVIHDSLLIELESIEELIDGGNTEYLISAVQDTAMSSENLRDSLMNNSPLSNQVLISLMNRGMVMAEEDFESLMNLNLPVSTEVLPDYLGMLAGINDTNIVNSLIRKQSDNPSVLTLFGINRSLEMVKIENYAFIYELADYYLENDSIDQYMDLMESVDDIHFKMNLVCVYLNNGQTSIVNELLSAINDSSESYVDWKSIIVMIKNLADSGKTVFSMDSTMKSMVLQIASKSEPTMAVMNAISIMRLVYGMEFDNFLLDFGSNESRIAQIIEQDIVKQNKTENYYYKVYPNPARNRIYVKRIGKTSDDVIKVVLKITDITGRLVAQEINFKNESQIEIDVTHLNAGFYFISIENGFGIFESHKLILEK